MSLSKLIIEFFLKYGAMPLVITALVMFVYVIYHISTLKSIHEYKSGKFILIWSIIAAPQVYGLILAERYKQDLPIHQLELTADSCRNYRKNEPINESQCLLIGRLVGEQNTTYIFLLKNKKVYIEKCHVLNIRKRDFSEYKADFDRLYLPAGTNFSQKE